jgi:hypothetical protein
MGVRFKPDPFSGLLFASYRHISPTRSYFSLFRSKPPIEPIAILRYLSPRVDG